MQVSSLGGLQLYHLYRSGMFRGRPDLHNSSTSLLSSHSPHHPTSPEDTNHTIFQAILNGQLSFIMTVHSKILQPLRGRVGIRSFSTSRARYQTAPLPSRKPVGAFRGGYVPLIPFLHSCSATFCRFKLHYWCCDSVFGFLAGSVAAGASVYYYILGEYRVANEMLSGDISVC